MSAVPELHLNSTFYLQAESLAAAAADRTAKKLSDHSELLADVRLQRDVERVYYRHQIPGTGVAACAKRAACAPCFLPCSDVRGHYAELAHRLQQGLLQKHKCRQYCTI